MTKYVYITLILLTAVSCGARSVHRFPPERWLSDRDTYAVEKPKSRRDYKYSDIADKQLFYRLHQAGNIPEKTRNLLYYAGLGTRKEALNVTNFDEAINSSWFANRLGRHPLSVQQIARGSNQGTGPDTRHEWTILAAKTTGLTPGFLIKDSRGDKYFIKFDPPGFPELASGAEVISTKLFHAFGYNVPENFVVTFDRSILKVSPDATTRDRYGRKIPFSEDQLEEIFSQCEQDSRGQYRALASKLLPGEPLGPFPLEGRRFRDKNDRIPHQYRRELRGYQVFAALTNHGDSRESNSLDMFVPTEGDRGYVKHYLIDFGGTLGSASVRPKGKDHLYDYQLNYARTLVALGLVGFYRPYWEDASSTSDPSVGFFEAKHFKPQSWKPTYLNPNFRRMSPRDGYWGAKIVMSLSDEDIRAIVAEAQYTRQDSADYIAQRLIERRDLIGRYWFKRVNPLDNFQLQHSGHAWRLSFDDLALRAGLASAGTTQYRYRWRNAHDGEEITAWRYATGMSLPLDLSTLKPGRSYSLQIQTKRHAPSAWSPAIDLNIQYSDELALLGLKRRY